MLFRNTVCPTPLYFHFDVRALNFEDQVLHWSLALEGEQQKKTIGPPRVNWLHLSEDDEPASLLSKQARQNSKLKGEEKKETGDSHAQSGPSGLIILIIAPLSAFRKKKKKKTAIKGCPFGLIWLQKNKMEGEMKGCRCRC